MRILAGAAIASTALFASGLMTQAAAAQCWPGTDQQPLKGEVVITTTGGSFAAGLKKVFWDRFEKECAVKVTSYPIPGRTLAQTITLIKSGNASFDLLPTASPEEFPLMKRAGVLQPVPAGIWDAVPPEERAPGAVDEYGMTSASVATLLIYSKAAFPNGLTSWADFWNVKKFPGARVLQNHPNNVVIALLSLGVAPKDIYPITDEKLARAFARLDEIRPYIRTYWSSADQSIQGVGRGEFVAGSAWSGRAFAARNQRLPIGISWNGNVIGSSTWIIPKGAKNPRAAAALLRFMNDHPAYQAEYAKLMGYGFPRSDVARLLPQDVVDNLATTPKNVAIGVATDAEWWADNVDRMGKLWSTWVATGKYSGKR